MNGVLDLGSDDSEFVEVDPTGRYGRYNEILGKGASKTVYRAFDEYEGIEVAWNQVKLYDFLQSPEDLESLYCEIHLLKTLKHSNIMKFYTSWVDIANRNINFVTEMFTSGTLRQYRLKHKRVNIRAIKHWCRQILQGLLYLHSHDPPIIHRDLKCDNIFINGNHGEVKIGDLGLAAILRKSCAARCVGTPEFMAPEIYEEEYNELVDIYSFGMCVLEMVTFKYPYSECSHPAQIYKKVISGKKPDALYKVKDPEIHRFVEKCLATMSNRHSAWELLNDPFLQIDDFTYNLRPLNFDRDCNEINPVLRQTLPSVHHSTTSSLVNGYSNHLSHEQEHDLDSPTVENEAHEHDFFTNHEDGHLQNVDITIESRRGDEDDIFLKLRIADKDGHVRNIYFPFDIEIDTALSVATEMVAELDIMDQDVTKIVEMIDNEIAFFVPEWRRLPDKKSSYCQNCVSDVSLVGYEPGKSRHIFECSEHKCGAIHGRFEEITYQSDASKQYVIDGTPMGSNESDTTCSKRNDPDFSFCVFGENRDAFEQSRNVKYSNIRTMVEENKLADDGKNEIWQELRCINAKYQMELKEPSDLEVGLILKSSSSDSEQCKKDSLSLIPGITKQENGDESEHKSSYKKHFSTIYPFHPKKTNNKDSFLLIPVITKQETGDESGYKSSYKKHFSSIYPFHHKKTNNTKLYGYNSAYSSGSSPPMVAAKSSYSSILLPRSLHRATSLQSIQLICESRKSLHDWCIH